MQFIDEELSVLLKAWLKEHREAMMHGEEGYFPAADVSALSEYAGTLITDPLGRSPGGCLCQLVADGSRRYPRCKDR